MKKIIYVIATFLVLLAISACNNNKNKVVPGGKPIITFTDTIYEFEPFDEKDAEQSCSFIFENTGDGVLFITHVFTSCSCTKTDSPEKPLYPGDKGKITIKYDGKGKKPGYFRKEVVVTSNAEKPVTLIIKGYMRE